jgi:hypothetical protein
MLIRISALPGFNGTWFYRPSVINDLSKWETADKG